MKKLSLLVLTLVLTIAFSGLAVAKTAPQKPLLPQEPNSRATETEPNDDFSTANPLTLGEDMNAAIDPAGDVDYFSITVDAGDVLNFETLPGDVGDTQMNLYDTDGVTVLEFDDDDGQNLYSLIEGYEFPAAGTYYVAINEFGDNDTGTYILSTSEFTPPEPQENDTCEGAINVADLEGLYAEFDLCLYTNQYDPGSGGCTGFPATGPEAVYMVTLEAGQTFFASASPVDGFIDLSVYLVTDCEDPAGSCVVGDDSGNPEEISYTPEEGGTYYLMIDTYSSCGDGLVGVTFDGVVATQSNSLTEIKGLFR
jgi:hypothetical protein